MEGQAARSQWWLKATATRDRHSIRGHTASPCPVYQSGGGGIISVAICRRSAVQRRRRRPRQLTRSDHSVRGRVMVARAAYMTVRGRIIFGIARHRRDAAAITAGGMTTALQTFDVSALGNTEFIIICDELFNISLKAGREKKK